MKKYGVRDKDQIDTDFASASADILRNLRLNFFGQEQVVQILPRDEENYSLLRDIGYPTTITGDGLIDWQTANPRYRPPPPNRRPRPNAPQSIMYHNSMINPLTGKLFPARVDLPNGICECYLDGVKQYDCDIKTIEQANEMLALIHSIKTNDEELLGNRTSILGSIGEFMGGYLPDVVFNYMRNTPPGQETCPECLQLLTTDVVKLSCNHSFHRNCIRVANTATTAKCPVCKQDSRIL